MTQTKAKSFLVENPKNVKFGDVIWKRGFEDLYPYQMEYMMIHLGTVDPDILCNMEIGFVTSGVDKDKIIGWRNLGEYEVRKITLESIPYCEMCRDLNSEKEVKCNFCGTMLCDSCAEDDDCCGSKYSPVLN